MFINVLNTIKSLTCVYLDFDPFDGLDDDGDLEHRPAPAGDGSVECEVYGGTLKFYFHDERFEATCDNVNHVTPGGRKCRLTRNLPAIGSADAATRGRCIGLFGKFLQISFDQRFTTGAMHRSNFWMRAISKHDREICRKEVKSNSPSGDVVSMCERDKANPGDDSEPENVF